MKKIINVLEYSLIILIVLNCRSVYQHTINNYRIKEILFIILGFLVAIKASTKNPEIKGKLSKGIVYMIIYEMYAILFYLINDLTNNKMKYIYNFLIFFPLLFIFYYIEKDSNKKIKDMLLKQSNIICVFAYISLTLFILGPVLNIMKPTGSIYYSWGIRKSIPSYLGLQFVTQKIIFLNKFLLVRNSGIFVEAPMYSLHLTIALAIQLFLNKKSKKINIVILLLNIITTYSTAGFIIAIICLSIRFVFYSGKTKIASIIKVLLAPTVIIIAFVGSYTLYSEKSETRSWSTRLDDYKAGLIAFKNNPIFGTGYENYRSFANYMEGSRTIYGTSNSITSLLGQCGIYLSLLYFFAFYKQIKTCIKNNDKGMLIFVCILIALFITTIFEYTIMMINFLAMFYVFKEEKDNECDAIRIAKIRNKVFDNTLSI